MCFIGILTAAQGLKMDMSTLGLRQPSQLQDRPTMAARARHDGIQMKMMAALQTFLKEMA